MSRQRWIPVPTLREVLLWRFGLSTPHLLRWFLLVQIPWRVQHCKWRCSSTNQGQFGAKLFCQVLPQTFAQPTQLVWPATYRTLILLRRAIWKLWPLSLKSARSNFSLHSFSMFFHINSTVWEGKALDDIRSIVHWGQRERRRLCLQSRCAHTLSGCSHWYQQNHQERRWRGKPHHWNNLQHSLLLRGRLAYAGTVKQAEVTCQNAFWFIDLLNPSSKSENIEDSFPPRNFLETWTLQNLYQGTLVTSSHWRYAGRWCNCEFRQLRLSKPPTENISEWYYRSERHDRWVGHTGWDSAYIHTIGDSGSNRVQRQDQHYFGTQRTGYGIL